LGTDAPNLTLKAYTRLEGILYWTPEGPTNTGFNFHQLRIFYIVARCRSFSRAADTLDISQPAVSIQVRELEKALGITLFHRRPGGPQLTEIGETVYSYAHRIFSLLSEMQDAIQDIQEIKTGHLTLGASTTPGEYILPVAIGCFRQHYPNVEVELKISNTRSIVTQILQRELDLGMIGNRPENGGDELEMSTYVIDEIVLVVNPGHPIANRKRLSLADVMEEGLVIRERGSATRQTAEECFAQLGIETRVAIELGSNQAVKLAAQSGVGVGVISRFGIGAEVKAGLLKVLEVEGWRCRRPLTLVYLKKRHLSPAQRAFLHILEEEHPLPSIP
jgi:DNA-binding transcriptional LysR family regulator